MKSKHTPQLFSLLAAGLVFAAPASAQWITGFEAAQSYSGTTLSGVDDPALSGTAAWYVPSGLSGGGSRQTYSGSSALRLVDTNSSGWAIGLNAAGAIDYSQPFNLSFDFALASVTTNGATGTAPVVNVRLGADTNSNSNKSWLRFSYNADGSLSLWTNSGGSTTQQVSIGNLATFASAGTYLRVSISVDPTTHTYTSLTLSGDTSSATISSIAGSVLPWIPNTVGEPPTNFWAHTTGAPFSTSYIDNISLTNIPEPSAFAAALGLAGLAFAGSRRRRG